MAARRIGALHHLGFEPRADLVGDRQFAGTGARTPGREGAGENAVGMGEAPDMSHVEALCDQAGALLVGKLACVDDTLACAGNGGRGGRSLGLGLGVDAVEQVGHG